MRINLELARTLLARARDTQPPDFVYCPGGHAACHYQPQPYLPKTDPRHHTGCLIGVALGLHGVTTDSGNSINSGEFAPVLTAEAAAYFRIAQVEQDRGQTWAEAVRFAEAELARYQEAGGGMFRNAMQVVRANGFVSEAEDGQ